MSVVCSKASAIYWAARKEFEFSTVQKKSQAMNVWCSGASVIHWAAGSLFGGFCTVLSYVL
jgi:hypothetical protein